MAESQYNPGDRVQLKIAFAIYREHYDDAFGNILDAGTTGIMVDGDDDGRLHFQPDGQDDHWYVLDHTLELERPAPDVFSCVHCGGPIRYLTWAEREDFPGKKFCTRACANEYESPQDSAPDAPDRLDEIEARLAARTPGKWYEKREFELGDTDTDTDLLLSISIGTTDECSHEKKYSCRKCLIVWQDDGGFIKIRPEDAALISHAPDYLEWSVAEIKRLRAEHKRQLVRNAELLQGNSILARRNESLSATLARRGLDDSGLPYGGEIDPNAKPESYTRAIEWGEVSHSRYSEDDDHNEALQDAFESDEDDNDDGRYERGCS